MTSPLDGTSAGAGPDAALEALLPAKQLPWKDGDYALAMGTEYTVFRGPYTSSPNEQWGVSCRENRVNSMIGYFPTRDAAKEAGQEHFAGRIRTFIEVDHVAALLDACRRAESWVSTYPEGEVMRDVLRAAITKAGQRP